MIRRINLFGRPGSGKSTVAAALYSMFKGDGYNIELVNEYVKAWAYMGREIKSFDQVYIFGQQMHAEDILLTSGVEYIITDSPLLIQYCYSSVAQNIVSDELYNISLKFDKVFPPLNILLQTEFDHSQYSGYGRYHNLGASLHVGGVMQQVLSQTYNDYIIVHDIKYDELYRQIKAWITK